MLNFLVFFVQKRRKLSRKNCFVFAPLKGAWKAVEITVGKSAEKKKMCVPKFFRYFAFCKIKGRYTIDFDKEEPIVIYENPLQIDCEDFLKQQQNN